MTTTAAKAEARILLEVATDIGRAGLHFAEILLRETPADSPDFNREAFFQRVEEEMAAEDRGYVARRV